MFNTESKYKRFYHCPKHKWILHGNCLDSTIGLICPICKNKDGKMIRVRTRPRCSNHAGEYIKDLKRRKTVDL